MATEPVALPARRGLDRAALRRSALMGLLGLAIWGPWAWWSNRSHGSGAAWQAGLTQGFISFTITLLIGLIVEAATRFGGTRRARFAAGVGAAFAFISIYSVTFHTIAGTPELLVTVAPAIASGVVFAALYAARLTLRPPA